jgi:glycine cleavage system aminomethyltransferase T
VQKGNEVAVEENPGILLYTRIRKSPYFYASRQHGVRRYSVYNHTYHPRHYGDPVREYWALLQGVTLWDVGVERQIEISGPDAFTFTNMMTPRDLSKCAVRQAKILEIPYYHMSEDLQLDGMRVCVSRTGYTGELGYEIYLHDATKNGTRLWNTVLEAGRPHGLEVIGPCHIRRIEGGILAFGADMWYDTNPFEVGMGYPWMVDLGQEAGFVGKQALQRIKADGPRRKLVGIEIGGPSVGTYIDSEMIDMYPVFRGGAQVGEVTSACYSPRLEANIGYAMLPAGLAEPLGQEFEVETPTGRYRGVTVRKPFIDPDKEIPKQ